jgi:hypothetical protein
MDEQRRRLTKVYNGIQRAIDELYAYIYEEDTGEPYSPEKEQEAIETLQRDLARLTSRVAHLEMRMSRDVEPDLRGMG